MTKTIGFIGCGNMARAIIGGMISSNLIPAENIIASAVHQSTLNNAQQTYGIQTSTNNKDVARTADILFLAVKPYLFENVISEVKDVIKDNAIVISIAAGQTIANIESFFSKKIKLVRVMPNTPAQVGESMSAVCFNQNVTPEEIDSILTLLNSFGKSEVIPEPLFHAVIGVAGSSPAYIFMMIEAMADAAVADGMPRAQAYKFAAQSMLGSAKMVLETGIHPGELKDAVCSPGGTTIEAVAVLEQEGFRNAVVKAQRACSEKSRKMSE